MKPGSHLTTERLIDLAERTREESSAPHLQSCEACRHQLAVLRNAISAAAEVEVPEPSPLFWERLSERVHEAVAAEGTRQRGFPGWWTGTLSSWRGWAVAAVAAAVMLSIYFATPRPPSQPSAGIGDIAVVPSAVAAVPLPVDGTGDDPALALVADLTSKMDQDAFDETGWTSHAGAADEAVDTLTDDERLELQRLLREELAKS